MKRASRLQKLWLSMKKRCRRLRQEAMLLRAPIGSAEREVGTSSLVINLLNIWGNFARSYYLSCMSECRCTGGHMVSVGMTGLTIHDCIGLAISIITPWNSFVPGTIPDRRREPTWHDPNTLLRIAASQAFSHRSDIVAAFSTGSRTFQDL